MTRLQLPSLGTAVAALEPPRAEEGGKYSAANKTQVKYLNICLIKCDYSSHSTYLFNFSTPKPGAPKSEDRTATTRSIPIPNLLHVEHRHTTSTQELLPKHIPS